FHKVPSFVLELDAVVEAQGLGRVRYDLAFGGAFYAYVKAEDVGLTCAPEDYRSLIEAGMTIKSAVAAARAIPHPFEEDLSFLYGVIFIGPASGATRHSRNVCVFAEGEVDRSPTGTGVSGRLAIHHARGEIGAGETIVIESVIGSKFTGRVAQAITFGPHDAIIPEVEGTARITGRHEFLIDPGDELRDGFLWCCPDASEIFALQVGQDICEVEFTPTTRQQNLVFARHPETRRGDSQFIGIHLEVRRFKPPRRDFHFFFADHFDAAG